MGILFGNEIGRLAQGIKGRVKGTNTMSFIKKEEVLQNVFIDVELWCAELIKYIYIYENSLIH